VSLSLNRLSCCIPSSARPPLIKLFFAQPHCKLHRSVRLDLLLPLPIELYKAQLYLSVADTLFLSPTIPRVFDFISFSDRVIYSHFDFIYLTVSLVL
jgi:hypothetical protein